MPDKIITGHKLKVGSDFESVGHWQTKDWDRDLKRQILRIRRPGDRDFFQHKNRLYYCEVLDIVETQVRKYGRFPHYATGWNKVNIYPTRTQWRFTYLVRIIENCDP